ncbi:MAG: DUF4870 domain-containing protein [Planctomycetaceae bacterium]|nr:DUF4870 domain-containing protein [Planctomycetaceae bacterium]
MDYQQQSPAFESQSVASKEQTTWALAAHLSGLLPYVGIPFGNIIAPLAIWLMNRDKMPFVDDQAKEAINFQLTITLYAIISGVLILAVVGFVLLPVVIVFDVVASIIAAIKAQQGIAYRYPMTIRFI